MYSLSESGEVLTFRIGPLSPACGPVRSLSGTNPERGTTCIGRSPGNRVFHVVGHGRGLSICPFHLGDVVAGFSCCTNRSCILECLLMERPDHMVVPTRREAILVQACQVSTEQHIVHLRPFAQGSGVIYPLCSSSSNFHFGSCLRYILIIWFDLYQGCFRHTHNIFPYLLVRSFRILSTSLVGGLLTNHCHRCTSLQPPSPYKKSALRGLREVVTTIRPNWPV